jgi:sec-independent protein translocase protein TatA
MNLFEPTHILILAIVVLVLFGAKKIPEFMRGVGQGVGELQKGLNEAKRTMNTAIDQEPAKTEPAAIQQNATAASTTTAETQKVQQA